MGKTGRLSRRPNWKVGIDKDNKNQIIIKDNWLCKLEEIIIEGPEVEKIKKLGIKTKK